MSFRDVLIRYLYKVNKDTTTSIKIKTNLNALLAKIYFNSCKRVTPSHFLDYKVFDNFKIDEL